MRILSQSQIGRQLLKGRSRRPLAAGFTLIQLMIVISIIMILVGIAAVQYQRSAQPAREATLKQDHQARRQSTDNYTLHTQAAPQALDDLARAGTVRSGSSSPRT